jgi:hypothetical protein
MTDRLSDPWGPGARVSHIGRIYPWVALLVNLVGFFACEYAAVTVWNCGLLRVFRLQNRGWDCTYMVGSRRREIPREVHGSERMHGGVKGKCGMSGGKWMRDSPEEIGPESVGEGDQMWKWCERLEAG